MSHWCPEIFRVHHPELQYKKPANIGIGFRMFPSSIRGLYGVFSIFINHVYLIKKTHTHTYTHTHIYIIYKVHRFFLLQRLVPFKQSGLTKTSWGDELTVPSSSTSTAPSTSRLYPSKTQPHLYIVQHMCYTNMLQKYSVKYHQWCRCKPIWCIFTNHLITARFSFSFGNSHPRTAGTCARWQQNTMFS